MIRCSECEVPFARPPMRGGTPRLTCGPICTKRRNNRLKKESGEDLRTCRRCGVSIAGTIKQARFCSHHCRNTHNQAADRPKTNAYRKVWRARQKTPRKLIPYAGAERYG